MRNLLRLLKSARSFFLVVAAFIIALAIVVFAMPLFQGHSAYLNPQNRTSDGIDPSVKAQSSAASSFLQTAGEDKSTGLWSIQNKLSTKRLIVFGLYNLKGIALDPKSPQSSSAVIEDSKTGISSVYHLNDRLPTNAQIIEILEDCVLLDKDGVRRTLKLNSNENRAEEKLKPSYTANGYYMVKDTEWDLAPNQAFAGDINKTLDLSLAFYRKDDQIKGIQVSNLKSSSIISSLGIREGDVLMEANGVALNSADQCLSSYFKAQASNQLALTIQRNNKPIILKYNLDWHGISQWSAREMLGTKSVQSLLGKIY